MSGRPPAHSPQAATLWFCGALWLGAAVLFGEYGHALYGLAAVAWGCALITHVIVWARRRAIRALLEHQARRRAAPPGRTR